MTIEEMERFTIEELEILTIEDLSLEVDELIKRFKDDSRTVPIQIVVSIQNLSEKIPNSAIKIENKLTVGMACTIIGALVGYLLALPELAEKYSPIVQSIIEAILSI